MKILAIDTGNTSAFFTHIDDGKFKKSFRFPTKKLKKLSALLIKEKFALSNIHAVVIASVVPEASVLLKRVFSQKIGIKTYIIGKDFEAPIENKYRDPKQVGIDRLMNAVAAYSHYQKEAIIIDFGTAITFDIVSRKGEYLGGVIAPGIEISLEALYRKTALLPKITLAHAKNIIGKDTVESIRVGCSVGIGGLCDRVVTEIIKRHHLKPMVIATGGYAKFMLKYCTCVHSTDSMLTMKGIFLSYKKFLTNKNL